MAGVAVERLPVAGPWRVWAPAKETDEDAAARAFVARYGEPPEFVLEHRGQLWLGPAPERSVVYGER